MTLDDARSHIREHGFATAMYLALQRLSVELMDEIANHPDYHVVEYAKADTESYRRKELYYYNPAD